MNCQRCGADAVAYISAKCSDLCFVRYPNGQEYDGYVPAEIDPIGDGGYGDYVTFDWCLECGQIQGDFNVG